MPGAFNVGSFQRLHHVGYLENAESDACSGTERHLPELMWTSDENFKARFKAGGDNPHLQLKNSQKPAHSASTVSGTAFGNLSAQITAINTALSKSTTTLNAEEMAILDKIIAVQANPNALQTWFQLITIAEVRQLLEKTITNSPDNSATLDLEGLTSAEIYLIEEIRSALKCVHKPQILEECITYFARIDASTQLLSSYTALSATAIERRNTCAEQLNRYFDNDKDNFSGLGKLKTDIEQYSQLALQAMVARETYDIAERMSQFSYGGKELSDFAPSRLPGIVLLVKKVSFCAGFLPQYKQKVLRGELLSQHEFIKLIDAKNLFYTHEKRQKVLETMQVELMGRGLLPGGNMLMSKLTSDRISLGDILFDTAAFVPFLNVIAAYVAATIAIGRTSAQVLKTVQLLDIAIGAATTGFAAHHSYQAWQENDHKGLAVNALFTAIGLLGVLSGIRGLQNKPAVRSPQPTNSAVSKEGQLLAEALQTVSKNPSKIKMPTELEHLTPTQLYQEIKNHPEFKYLEEFDFVQAMGDDVSWSRIHVEGYGEITESSQLVRVLAEVHTLKLAGYRPADIAAFREIMKKYHLKSIMLRTVKAKGLEKRIQEPNLPLKPVSVKAKTSAKTGTVTALVWKRYTFKITLGSKTFLFTIRLFVPQKFVPDADMLVIHDAQGKVVPVEILQENGQKIATPLFDDMKKTMREKNATVPQHGPASEYNGNQDVLIGNCVVIGADDLAILTRQEVAHFHQENNLEWAFKPNINHVLNELPIASPKRFAEPWRLRFVVPLLSGTVIPK